MAKICNIPRMQNDETFFSAVDEVLQCDYFLAVSTILQTTPQEQVLQHLFGINFQKANVILAKMMADGFLEYCPKNQEYIKKLQLSDWLNLVTVRSALGHHMRYSDMVRDSDMDESYQIISYRRFQF